MTQRFAITAAARAEAVEVHGYDFAESILGLFDARRGLYAPVCADSAGNVYLDESRARPVWDDMLEAVR